jgi:hypothetical protein
MLEAYLRVTGVIVPALVLWVVAFRFVPFCARMWREAKATERMVADDAERALTKLTSLRNNHDELLAALDVLVRMHRGGPDAVGNWDWAFDRAEKAVARARGPLIPEALAAPEPKDKPDGK